jgi:signal peptidase I
MIPTLLVGDYLFVSKYSYGYSRFSFPFGLGLFPGRILGSDPERGDIAVFKKPTDDSTDYIKRIVGLPGDRIQVRGGVLYINGERVPRQLVGHYLDPDRGATTIEEYRETLPNGVSYRVLDAGPNGALDNTLEYVVPAGHYFAMGDNRDNSQDSRILNDVGYIPAENLIGRAEIIFFSIDGEILRLWEWPFTVRLGRLFQLLG